jgi:RND family efflux transporter MFP subunit
MAAPGTPLLRLEDTRSYRLDVRVDESRIGQIRSGASVNVVLDSAVGDGTKTVAGTVTEISRTVDADARAFLVKITLADPTGLRSGLFGRARFEGEVHQALTVPSGALVRRGQVASVFVVEKGIARVRLVNVSDREVLAGLSEGETVIVDPPSELTDGRQVREGGR